MLVTKTEIPPYQLVKSCCSEPPSSPTFTAVSATPAYLVGSSGPSHDPAAKGLMLDAAEAPQAPPGLQQAWVYSNRSQRCPASG